MAKRTPKNTFKPGNQIAAGHSEGKTGGPTKAARAAVRELMLAEHQIRFKDGKGGEKTASEPVAVNLHEEAIRTLYLAMRGRDMLGHPTVAAVRAAEMVIERTHGPVQKDDADQRPPMTLVVNCAPIVNNQLNVGGHNHA